MLFRGILVLAKCCDGNFPISSWKPFLPDDKYNSKLSFSNEEVYVAN